MAEFEEGGGGEAKQKKEKQRATRAAPLKTAERKY